MVLVAEGLEGRVRQTMRKCGLVADRTIVLATPVDTGRARANWLVSFRSPASDVPEGAQSGESKEARGAGAAAKALAQANKKIAEYEDGSIFITNNVAYIVPLDKGSSRQAPEGMIRAGLAAAADVARRARLLEG